MYMLGPKHKFPIAERLIFVGALMLSVDDMANLVHQPLEEHRNPNAFT
jgi:hypothetical protein